LCSRLHAPEDVDDGKMAFSISHFLPSGGSEMGSAPVELIYYVTEGEMTIYINDNKEYCLKAGDSIHLRPNQGRYCRNTGIVCATMLVVTAR
jgi:quercetin dioxygenase-like cupin family protein